MRADVEAASLVVACNILATAVCKVETEHKDEAGNIAAMIKKSTAKPLDYIKKTLRVKQSALPMKLLEKLGLNDPASSVPTASSSSVDAAPSLEGPVLKTKPKPVLKVKKLKA